jgi:hypothetical protein
MKKFVATFKNAAGKQLFLPLHADDISIARLYAQTIEHTSSDFWGSSALKLVDVREIQNEQPTNQPAS